jgi:biotin transport system substrate-specific component
MPMLAIFLGGHALILACGWARLALMIGPQAAFDSGVAPFLLGSVLKSILAALAIRIAERWMRERER